ncbi:thioesterase II family protein [Pseudosporangium ferrugineum]|uniref:thioesterase II family protein n=1 Tax=Pseudosporangium ferrugineum TaxID=439699 RepID=UPI0013047FD6|nr:alpha/beta fold hydrolase [Pseudosporangium ferrugineum]
MTRRWLLCREPRPDAGIRLYIFPHSGSSPGEYIRWSDGLPGVEVHGVQLPGRGTRFREPPFTRMTDLVDAITGEVRFQAPYAFFGHSLGGLIAYEVARRLRDRGDTPPGVLMVSGLDPPHLQPPRRLPPARVTERMIQRLPGQQLGPDCLKADLNVLRSYVHTPSPPLPGPIVVLGGTDDDQPEDLGAWSGYGRGPAEIRLFPGGHHYHREHHDDLHPYLLDALRRHRPDAAEPDQ